MELITTRQGKLLGKKEEGYTVFYGVPYAKPPVGARRFCPPEALATYKGVRDARQLPSRLWQPQAPPDSPSGREFCSVPEYLTAMSEDCLFVHIWTPAKSPDEQLPVAFWIHGGAFTKGFGAEAAYDGAAFCRERVILVSVDYRMGAFGFLCHPWLAAEGGGICGNNGILDQIAALRWVRENIAAFGGDPDRITVMGQSAGAASVQALVSSHLTEGMIAGAVLQSGGGYHSPIGVSSSQREAEESGVAFAEICGAKSLEELRRLPPQFLVDAALVLQERYNGQPPFVPVVDGYALLASFDSIAKSGGHRDIPYLLGSTADDISFPPNNRTLHDSAVDWSRLNLRLGRQPSFVYRFDRTPPGGHGAYTGAYHSAELWYLFGTLGRSWRPYTAEDRELSERMIHYWSQFVKSGNPNGEGLPEWGGCTGHADVLLLDVKQ